MPAFYVLTAPELHSTHGGRDFHTLLIWFLYCLLILFILPIYVFYIHHFQLQGALVLQYDLGVIRFQMQNSLDKIPDFPQILALPKITSVSSTEPTLCLSLYWIGQILQLTSSTEWTARTVQENHNFNLYSYGSLTIHSPSPHPQL